MYFTTVRRVCHEPHDVGHYSIYDRYIIALPKGKDKLGDKYTTRWTIQFKCLNLWNYIICGFSDFFSIDYEFIRENLTFYRERPPL